MRLGKRQNRRGKQATLLECFCVAIRHPQSIVGRIGKVCCEATQNAFLVVCATMLIVAQPGQAQVLQRPNIDIDQPRIDAGPTPIPSRQYKILGPVGIDGLEIEISADTPQALPRDGYRVLLGRGGRTFEFKEDAFLEEDSPTDPAVMAPYPFELPSSEYSTGVADSDSNGLFWLTLPINLSDTDLSENTIVGEVRGLEHSSVYCLAVLTQTVPKSKIEQVDCGETARGLHAPKIRGVGERQNNANQPPFLIAYRDNDQTESSYNLFVAPSGRRDRSTKFIIRRTSNESRYTGWTQYIFNDYFSDILRNASGELCFSMQAFRSEADGVEIKSVRSGEFCKRFGSEPSPTPSPDEEEPDDPTGVKALLVWNCHFDRRSVYVWGRDLSVAGSAFTQRQQISSDWDGSSCPGNNDATQINVPAGKSTIFVVVDPGQLSCQAGNDPLAGGCHRVSPILMVGDADGEFYPLIVN